MNRVVANQIDLAVNLCQPQTKRQLEFVLSQFRCQTRIEDVFYLGAKQGVRVIIKGKKYDYVRPGRGFVYSIFREK